VLMTGYAGLARERGAQGYGIPLAPGPDGGASVGGVKAVGDHGEGGRSMAASEPMRHDPAAVGKEFQVKNSHSRDDS
jgi:hypothetical protein